MERDGTGTYPEALVLIRKLLPATEEGADVDLGRTPLNYGRWSVSASSVETAKAILVHLNPTLPSPSCTVFSRRNAKNTPEEKKATPTFSIQIDKTRHWQVRAAVLRGNESGQDGGHPQDGRKHNDELYAATDSSTVGGKERSLLRRRMERTN
jgi:hypothetical protein